MENTYGIGVKNRYELFYDEDVDPLEIIREREEAKEKRKTDKTQTKDKNKSVKPGKPLPTATASKKPKESPPATALKPIETTEILSKPRTRPFADRNTKGPRNFDESRDTEEKKNFRNKDETSHQSFEPRERDGEMRRGRGGGFRGRGRPRGRGNFFNADNRPPRRDFDRHTSNDKSGVRTSDKKDGAGSNNWGDMRTDFNSRKREPDSTWDEEFESSGDKMNDSTWETTADTFTPNPGKEEIPVEQVEEPTANENNESKENCPVEERSDEVMREMTLDEWKKEQEAKRAVPKYNLRKPGEGEDGNQWKKLYMLKKKAKENGEEEDDDEEDEDVDVSK